MVDKRRPNVRERTILVGAWMVGWLVVQSVGMDGWPAAVFAEPVAVGIRTV